MRLFLHAWLACLLLFSQLGAAAHAVSHFSEQAPSQSEQGKQLPHSPACEKCVLFAQLGGATAASPLAFQATGVEVAPRFLEPADHAFRFLRVYSSRAPPHLG